MSNAIGPIRIARVNPRPQTPGLRLVVSVLATMSVVAAGRLVFLTPHEPAFATVRPLPVDGRPALNSASRDELLMTPGVGNVLADRLLNSRPFASASETTRVHGIGPALSKKLEHSFRFPREN